MTVARESGGEPGMEPATESSCGRESEDTAMQTTTLADVAVVTDQLRVEHQRAYSKTIQQGKSFLNT